MSIAIPAILLGLGFWGVTKATEPPLFADIMQDRITPDEPPGLTNEMDRVQAQDMQENGIWTPGISRTNGNLYSWTMRVLDPGQVSVNKLSDFKSAMAADRAAFNRNNLQQVFDPQFANTIPPNTGTRPVLIGLLNRDAEIHSGTNAPGMNLLTSNPYVYYENPSHDSRIKNNTGWVPTQIYNNTSSLVTNPNNEVQMSWAGLRNPWRPGGLQYQLHSTYTPPDKDQLTGQVPIAHPRSVLDAAGRPTPITAPPQRMQTTRIMGRNTNLMKRRI